MSFTRNPKGNLAAVHELPEDLDHSPTLNMAVSSQLLLTNSKLLLSPIRKGRAQKQRATHFSTQHNHSLPRGGLPPLAEKDPTWTSKQAVGVV